MEGERYEPDATFPSKEFIDAAKATAAIARLQERFGVLPKDAEIIVTLMRILGQGGSLGESEEQEKEEIIDRYRNEKNLDLSRLFE